MNLQSNYLNTVRLINLFYIEIILQVVFIIWLYIPALHWAGNNIGAWVDSIQSGINLQYIPNNIYLDICSTYNQLTEEKYVTNIHQSKSAFYGDCNLGVPVINKKGKRGTMNTWINP